MIPTGDLEVEVGELRAPAALPRRKGIWGDILYVGTVVFGRRSIRRELVETEQEIEAEKRSRDKELTELARLAVSDPEIEMPEVEEAREQLVALEEVRSRKAGAAAAAEQAIGNILRERDKIKEARDTELTELAAEIAKLEEELAPHEKRRVEIGKRARALAEQLAEFDARIEAETASIEAAPAHEAAVAEAGLAGLRAERDAIAANEPLLISELGEVDPAIREIKKKKNGLGKAMSKLRRAEDESVVRSAEKVTAARAHKTVVDRAAADRTREQNELLCELGDVLWRNPPSSILSLAAPLEERAAHLDRLKDRAVVCREKLASVEVAPLVRGGAIWLAVALVLGLIAYVVLGP